MTFTETLRAREKFCEERFEEFNSMHEAYGKMMEEVTEVGSDVFNNRNPCYEFLDVVTVCLSAARSSYKFVEGSCFFCGHTVATETWENLKICTKCNMKGF